MQIAVTDLHNTTAYQIYTAAAYPKRFPSPSAHMQLWHVAWHQPKKKQPEKYNENSLHLNMYN